MPLSSVNLTLLSLVSILQPPSITSRSTGEPCPTFFLQCLIFSLYFSAVRAHGGLVIADEVLSRNIFLFSKNPFSESDRSWPDWRAHVGLPKLWSGPRYCHHWTFHVQRLSYGCCDMFQVDDKSLRASFNLFNSQGRCQNDWEDTSPHLAGIQSPAPSASPS